MIETKCESCGAINRLDGFSYKRVPYCGRCKTQLREPKTVVALRKLDSFKYWIILSAILGGAYVTDQLKRAHEERAELPAHTTNGNQSPALQPPVTPAKSSRPRELSDQEVGLAPRASKGMFDDIPQTAAPTPLFTKTEPEWPEVPFKQGVHRVFTEQERIAPFQIVTPVGEESYYVKLVDVTNGKTVMTMFVRGGQTWETKVPLGSFRVKYATGMKWYGPQPERLFGPQTRVNEADSVFHFRVEGNRVNGYTIQLIKQVGGNLKTRPIGRNDF